VSVVAGDAQSQIDGVRAVLAKADFAQCARPGDLLVVLDAPPRPGWHTDAMLRRCADAGVACIAFDSGYRLDSGAVAIAERHGLGVLRTSDPWRLSIAADRLIHAPTNARIGALIKTVVAALRRAGESLDELLATLSAATGHTFLLLDDDGRALAGDPHGLLPEDAGRGADAAHLAGCLVRTGTLVDERLPSGRRLVAERVEVGEAWVAALLSGEDGLDAGAVSVALAVVKAATAQRIASLHLFHEREARIRAGLLTEILDASPGLSADLRRRALEVGWDLRGWHVGIRILVRGDAPTRAHRDALLAAFAAQALELTAVDQNDGWIAWITFRRHPGQITEQVSAAIRRAQAAFAPILPTAVGVGKLMAGPEGLARTIGQAADAAKIALNRPASGNYVHVDRLGLAQLLLALTHTDVFVPAARELLAPLGPPDGPLLNTLTAYLDAGSSQAETAIVLGIHRNTVSLRLARIMTLLAVDLAEPETRLALHLACRAVQSAT
jgi:hypothetical protein